MPPKKDDDKPKDGDKPPPSFFQWLDEKNVISVGIAFSISLAVNKFMKVLIDNLVTGIIGGLIKADSLEIKIREDLPIKYGEVIIEFLNLIMILYFSYLIIVMSIRFLGWT